MHWLTQCAVIGTIMFGAVQSSAAAEDVATDYWTRIFGGVWLVSTQGEFSASADGIEGDLVDTDDFDLDSFTGTIMLEGSVSLPLLLDFHAGVFSYSADGSQDFGAGIDFDGITLTGDVQADLDLVDIYVEAAWRPLALDLAGASIGLALHYIDGEVEMSELSGSLSSSVSEGIPMPAVSLRGYVNPIDELSFEARIHAMRIDIGDIDATYYDILAMATYRPLEWIGVVGGVRAVHYDVFMDIDDDAEADIDLSLLGPFVGGMFVF